MTDRAKWILLAEESRTKSKMALLARDFEKKKGNVRENDERTVKILNDFEKAKGIGCGIITYIDPEYPQTFKDLNNPPAFLYYKGDIGLLNYPVKVTVVGSRAATIYGINTASQMAMEIAEDGVVVVSGGAKGIDSAALRGALRAGGKVICVIGTGIDKVYPAENKKLFDDIVASGGLIISQFHIGMGPLGKNFPIRNTLMTALADSVLVVEADFNSGSLITAARCEEMGKTLFAVPGNVDSPNSRGTNALIRDGALVALSGADVVFELMERENNKFHKAKEYVAKKSEEVKPVKKEATEKVEGSDGLTPYEKAVVKAINEKNDTYDDILEFTGMEPKKLTSLLTIMEMKGIIKLAFGNRYKILD